MTSIAVNGPADAAVALELFPGCHKIRSWLALHLLGLPTLAGVVLSAPEEASWQSVREFSADRSLTRLMVRSDQARETGVYPRGGYLIDLVNLELELAPLFASGRTVVLLEPRSPLDDLYSMGINAWPEDPIITIEIVGPGFDASDLKRGEFSPHERLKIARTDRQPIAHDLIASDTYRVSWQERLNKVATLLARSPGDIWWTSEPLPPEEAIDLLVSLGETFLLESADAYRPISHELLCPVVQDVLRLGPSLMELGLPGEPLMTSMSYVGRDATPVYWDVVWPSLKFSGIER